MSAAAPTGGADALEVVTVDDPAAEAGRRIVAALVDAVRVRGRATVAFSGGSSAPPLLDVVAAGDVDWSVVDVLQVDERVVPDGDPARNATALLDRLVRPAGVPEGRVHLMPVATMTPGAAADAYGATLQQVTGAAAPVIDVVHLGLGVDGHTASLVPGDGVLDVDEADVGATGPYGGPRRVTLTFPVLDRAARRVWLVPGHDKAEAVQRLREGDRTIPAGRVRRDRSVLVLPTVTDP